VVDKNLKKWKNPTANDENKQLNDAAQNRAQDSAQPYKNQYQKTSDQINKSLMGDY